MRRCSCRAALSFGRISFWRNVCVSARTFRSCSAIDPPFALPSAVWTNRRPAVCSGLTSAVPPIQRQDHVSLDLDAALKDLEIADLFRETKQAVVELLIRRLHLTTGRRCEDAERREDCKRSERANNPRRRDP